MELANTILTTETGYDRLAQTCKKVKSVGRS